MSQWEVLRAALEQIWWQHRRAWRTTLVLYGIITGLVIDRWIHDPSVEAGLELLGSVTVVIIAYLIFALQRIWRAYHQAGHLGRKYLVTISDDGLTFEVDFDGLTMSWGTFSDFTETNNFFLLAHRTGGAFALPKRAFRGRDQIEHWSATFEKYVV